MKLNLKKLDATIEKLQALRRLATDPALADFVEITGGKTTSNGAGSSVVQAPPSNGHGQLKASVVAACKDLVDREFTVKDVVAQIGAHASSEKSIANILRGLASDGEIKIALAGKGRRPTSYRAA